MLKKSHISKTCTFFGIFGTKQKGLGQNAPYHRILDKLPPQKEKVENLKILRETNKGTAALAELKEIGKYWSIKISKSRKRNLVYQ